MQAIREMVNRIDPSIYIYGDRLRECCKALLLHKDKDIKYIMGSGIDVLKLKTSMCLFNKVSPNDVFEEVLDAFF